MSSCCAEWKTFGTVRLSYICADGWHKEFKNFELFSRHPDCFKTTRTWHLLFAEACILVYVHWGPIRRVAASWSLSFFDFVLLHSETWFQPTNTWTMPIWLSMSNEGLSPSYITYNLTKNFIDDYFPSTQILEVMDFSNTMLLTIIIIRTVIKLINLVFNRIVL